jgi:anti-sigma factor RsiW
MSRHVSPENLSAYVDEVLTVAEQREVEKHLLLCEPCQKQFADVKQVASWLRQKTDYPAQPFFAARLMAAIKTRRERSFMTDFVWLGKRLVPGLALVVAGVLIWTSWRTPEAEAWQDDYLTMLDSSSEMKLLATGDTELTRDEVLQWVVYETPNEE